ncbi:uncharacterized protein [Dermacentor andersoni]|uniref:uncharacterized protein n=1 Tax=Dermacentor andersoni TaxID=34620 RepID=UPI002417E262|nr:uncharacterized protein LOC126520695 [Dermacentor andersoni]
MPLWRTRLALWIRENPYFGPLFIRVTLSLVLVLYLSLGASVFMVLTSGDEDWDVSTVAELRNRTAERLIGKLKTLTSRPEAWNRAVIEYLVEYDERMSGVDHRGCATGREPWSFSDAMLFSLVLLTTSAARKRCRDLTFNEFISLYIHTTFKPLAFASAGGYDYTKTSTAVKVAIVGYICFGVPLLFGWLLLHGKTVAQTWLLACANAYRLFTGLRKRFRSVSPGSETEDVPAATPPTHATTLFRPELSIVSGHLSYAQLAPKDRGSRIRVVSVGTPRGTTVVVNRRALTAAAAALFCLFLLYVVFGAGAMAASSSTGSGGQTTFDGLFWIFLQFTTTSSNPYATFGTSPGARGGWALYYAVGALQLAAVAYMIFALVTWRCAFCADNWTAQSSQA